MKKNIEQSKNNTSKNEYSMRMLRWMDDKTKKDRSEKSALESI